MTTTNNVNGCFGDTKLTKVFVGGLAWDSNKEAMHDHFIKYGDILEAVIISDKLTRRSKGYGFVCSLLSLFVLFFLIYKTLFSLFLKYLILCFYFVGDFQRCGSRKEGLRRLLDNSKLVET